MEAPQLKTQSFFHDHSLPSPSSSSSSCSSLSPKTPRPQPPLSPHQPQAPQPQAPPQAPQSPKPIPRTIETTPYPTTFVQADTASFKQVVQMLTGGSADPSAPGNNNFPAGKTAAAASNNPAAKATAPKKPAFKLYERRSSMKNLKMISPLPSLPFANGAAALFSSPRKQEILSPSVLDFPSLVLSPVTPLIPDPFNRSPKPPQPEATVNEEEEERAAIAEKRFYLHPSPRGAEPPRLLPLFPVTSPRVATSASSQS